MTERRPGEAAQGRVTRLLRGGLLALAALGVVGAAVDMGMARHWHSAI